MLFRITIIFTIVVSLNTKWTEANDHYKPSKRLRISNELRDEILKSPKMLKYIKYEDENKFRILVKYLFDKNHQIKGYLKKFSDQKEVPCVLDDDCGRGQICQNNRCTCNLNHVYLNATHCLPGVLLGFPCQNDIQCRVMVSNTSCVRGFCECEEGSFPYRKANCVKVAQLGQFCRSDAQCKHGVDGSFCDWIVPKVLGKCSCKTDRMREGEKCKAFGNGLGEPCTKTYDCTRHVVGSICSPLDSTLKTRKIFVSASKSNSISHTYLSPSGVCVCPEGSLSIEKGTRCLPVSKSISIKSVSLGKTCDSSSECQFSDPNSFCDSGVCNCVRPSTGCSSKATGCPNQTFQCESDGSCISGNFVCNGVPDCNDGSDEAQCHRSFCHHLSFTCEDGNCIERNQVCDGRPDCPDRSDESRCFANSTNECPVSTFKCSNGQCIPGYEFCNAMVKCSDGSDEDERNCIATDYLVPFCPFRCKNGRCRSQAIICSGTDGCGDNSDEENCSVCSCPAP